MDVAHPAEPTPQIASPPAPQRSSYTNVTFGVWDAQRSVETADALSCRGRGLWKLSPRLQQPPRSALATRGDACFGGFPTGVERLSG